MPFVHPTIGPHTCDRAMIRIPLIVDPKNPLTLGKQLVLHVGGYAAKVGDKEAKIKRRKKRRVDGVD